MVRTLHLPHKNPTKAHTASTDKHASIMSVSRGKRVRTGVDALPIEVLACKRSKSDETPTKCTPITVGEGLILDSAIDTMRDGTDPSAVMTAMSQLCALYPNSETPVQAALSGAFCRRGGLAAAVVGMARNADEKYQEGVCEMLWRIVQEVHEDLPAWIPCAEAVVGAMRKHEGCEKLQLYGCTVLVCVSVDYNTHSAMARTGAVAASVAAMRTHPRCLHLQYKAIFLFSQLSSVYMPGFDVFAAQSGGDAVVREAVHAMLHDRQSALKSVMHVMRTHSCHMAIQQRGSVFLDNVCVTDAARVTLVIEGVVEHVVGVMEMQTDHWDVYSIADLVSSGCVSGMCAEVNRLAGTIKGSMCVLLNNCTRRHVIEASAAHHPLHTGAITSGTTSELVMAAMLGYQEHTKMQEAGLATLANVVAFANRGAVSRSVGPDHARIMSVGLQTIQHHRRHANIGKRGCVLLASLVETYSTVQAGNADAFERAMLDDGGVVNVVRLMHDEPNARMVVVGCVLVMRLSVFSRAMCSALCAGGIVECIMRALHAHIADSVLVFECVKSLCVICENSARALARLGHKDAAVLVARAMRTHHPAERVQTMGVSLWGRMPRTVNTKRVLWGESTGESPLIAAMRLHPDNTELQLRGLWTLQVHIPCILSRTNVCVIGAVVLSAMRAHPHNANVQALACLVLLLWHARVTPTNCPFECFAPVAAALHMAARMHSASAHVQERALEVLGKIYSSTLSLADDLYAAGSQACAVYIALETHAENCGVLAGCFGVILNILGENVVDDTRSAKLPGMGHQLVGGVMHVMCAHPASARIQEQGCLILWKMAHGSPANKHEIVRAGGLELFRTIMRSFVCDSAVLTRVFGVLESLVAEDSIRAKLCTVSVAAGVVRLMRHHEGVSLMQVPASGFLCALTTEATGVAASDAARGILHDGGVATLLHVMTKNLGDVCIQTNCIQTLANMSTSSTAMRDDMARIASITAVVLSVARQYQMSLAMQNGCFDVLASIAGDDPVKQSSVQAARTGAHDIVNALMRNALLASPAL